MIFIRKSNAIVVIILAIILSIGTHIIPIFFSVPRWVYLNIAGTFLIIYAFGTFAGMFYAGVLNIIISSIGMGAGVILPVLLSKVMEAGLIGGAKRKGSISLCEILVSSIFLGIVVKPFSRVLYDLFYGNSIVFKDFVDYYAVYLKSGLIGDMIVYFVSGIIAYTLFNVISRDKLIGKKER